MNFRLKIQYTIKSKYMPQIVRNEKLKPNFSAALNCLVFLRLSFFLQISVLHLFV